MTPFERLLDLGWQALPAEERRRLAADWRTTGLVDVRLAVRGLCIVVIVNDVELASVPLALVPVDEERMN